MPWNGSGQFNRTTGVSTGATVWDDAKVAARNVRADDHDTHDEDIATGLENTVARDGQNAASADLPMGGFKHTNVDDATTRNQYAAVGQVQDDSFNFIPAASVAGTADAITLSPSPAITAYAAGQRFSFVAEGTNTTATTVDISGLGAKAIQKHGAALVAGDITTSDLIVIIYDGTQFQIAVPAAARPLTIGKHTIWIPAGAMRPTVSNGCAALTDVETTAARPDMQVLDFDATADEHAQFQIGFPKSWNEGTITFQVYWTVAAAVTTGVAWGLQGVAVSDDGTIDVAYGTAVVVTDDALNAAEDLMVSAESAAVTIAGTPAVGDVSFFRIFRDVSDANDDMTQDARLIGVQVFYTLDAGDDT